MPKHSARLSVLMAGGVLLASSLTTLSATAQDNVLATLKPGHARLFTTDADVAAIKKLIQTDPIAKHNYQEVRASGDAMLAEPVKTYTIKGGTLLAIAHVVENRVLTLAGLYRITGDMRFAIRAKQEMLAAAGFVDWNPHHFLETAELTAALGVGYDWLYAILTPAERATIHAAILHKGILPWLDNMHGDRKLARMGNNWVQVCTGGITVGALAIADEDPAVAKEVLDDSRPIMKDIMTLFAPDGGFEEGTTYWDYAVSYNVLYLAALTSALGTDFGISEAKGFSNTGDYRIQSIGPLWRPANFSDAHEEVPRAFEMYWLSTRFHKPQYQLQEERFSQWMDKAPDARKHWQNERFAIFSLFWYSPVPASTPVDASLSQNFVRINQAFLRSSWNGSTPWYVAFKGGDNKAHHAHLDLGTFILDGLGQRWALDLGGEDYSVPGYFDFKEQRWTYYRTRTEGHNTLVVDEQNEDLDASAPLSFVSDKPNHEVAVMDLSKVYKTRLKDWKRGVAILDGNRVLVQDEVTPVAGAKVVWHFHTDASVKLAASGREATLSHGGETILVRILSPEQARFEVKDVSIPAPQTKAPGVSDLLIPIANRPGGEVIRVLFSNKNDATTVPAETTLATWAKP